MLSLLHEMPIPKSKKNEMNVLYTAVFYMLCGTHTILECRRAFSPRGVANDPGWSASDLLTLAQMLAKLLDYDDMNPKEFLSRIAGIAIDVIYGTQCKDSTD
jgi:hypothetical protein